jgi:hypothetical protein
MTENGLPFAHEFVRTKYSYFDDKLALSELLERRHLSQGHTPQRADTRTALCQFVIDTDDARIGRLVLTTGEDAQDMGYLTRP